MPTFIFKKNKPKLSAFVLMVFFVFMVFENPERAMIEAEVIEINRSTENLFLIKPLQLIYHRNILPLNTFSHRKQILSIDTNVGEFNMVLLDRERLGNPDPSEPQSQLTISDWGYLSSDN